MRGPEDNVMNHQVAIAAICASFALAVLARFVTSQKSMRVTLYLVVVPVVVSLALVAEFLQWHR